jgi:hypothetical protein
MRRLVAFVVGNIWSRVEELIDTVSAVRFVDGASIFFGFRLDNGTKIAEETIEMLQNSQCCCRAI